VFLFAPIIKIGGVEHFTGRGGTAFVGGGSAVFGYMFHQEYIGFQNEHIDFWINVGDLGNE
jgi:hypothetical protein